MKFKKKNLLNSVDDNKNIIFGVFVIIFVFSICLLPLLSKGTHSTEDVAVTDILSITCPETAIVSGEVECSIKLNSVTITTQGISAKYNISEGMEYVEFIPDTIWNTYEDTNYYESDGFILVSDGVSGSVNIGTVKYKIPSTATSNEIYKVELVDITIGDGTDTVVELENASDEIRILSSINTLDSITLSDGSLNEEFDSSKLEYTATVDVDKVSIEVTKTDERSSVVLDEEIELHYGTNTVNIVVTAEDGTEKTYILNIFREYEFNSEIYIYNEEDNYIYTSTDVDKDIILKNISVPNEFSKDIDAENNKLIISYNEEKLLEIDILNIIFDKYVLEENVVYIDNDLSYDNFINGIDKDEDIILKLFNGDEVIDTGNILDGMILKVYYNDKELDTFNITVYSLKFDESLTIDEEKKYIKYLTEGTKVEELLNNIDIVGGDIKLYNSNGTIKNNTDVLATGDVLTVYLNEEIKDQYVISVIGDANGDGVIDLIDLSQMRKHIVGWIHPTTKEIQIKTGIYYYSLDFNKDGIIDLIDLSKMRKTIVGLI